MMADPSKGPKALPIELWRNIIRFATDLDDPLVEIFGKEVLQLPPHSRESMRAKSVLSRVSRVFHSIAREYLYEAATLRSVAACEKFLRVLQAHEGSESGSADRGGIGNTEGASPANRVRMLRVQLDEETDRGRHEVQFCETVTRILQKTRHLDSLAASMYNESEKEMGQHAANAMLRAIPSSITHLSWQRTYQCYYSLPERKEFSELTAALVRLTRLRVLVLYVHEALHKMLGRNYPGALPQLTVTHLSVTSTDGRRELADALWTIPGLTHARFTEFAMWKAPSTPQPGIVYLDAGNSIYWGDNSGIYWREQAEVEEFVRRFPRLRTFAFSWPVGHDPDEAERLAWTAEVAHPSITTIKIIVCHGLIWKDTEEDLDNYYTRKRLPLIELPKYLNRITMEHLPALQKLEICLHTDQDFRYMEQLQAVVSDGTVRLRKEGVEIMISYVHKGDFCHGQSMYFGE